MTSQVEQDAWSFMGAYGRNGCQWVKGNSQFWTKLLKYTHLIPRSKTKQLTTKKKIIIIIIMIIITCFTRINPLAKAVINGCPGQLKITNNKSKKDYNNIINNPKNRLQNRW